MYKDAVMTTELASALWVAGGGALGAFGRYRISVRATTWFGKAFPCGTLIVNVLGSFCIGLLAGLTQHALIPPRPWHDFIGEGLLGALTTFSTFSMDSFAAFRDGQPGTGVLNIFLNAVPGLGAVALGFWLAAE